MEAIILAGGLGTRLKSVVKDVPKPMADISGKPFLYFVFQYLKRNGVDKVILCVGYKWEIIQAYFGDSFDGLSVHYSVEEELLGTGGAIRQALNYCQEQNVFILNGDTFFDISLADLMKVHRMKQANLTIALKHMTNFDRYGCVELDENSRVTAFAEKEFRNSGNINGGIYVAQKTLFNNLVLPNKFSFELFMQENCNSAKIFAKASNDYFIDIGIPEDYDKACQKLIKLI